MSDKTPSSEPYTGSQTPGWNDPPALQYNPLPLPRTRLNLNKRVAFPLQGTAGGDSKAAVAAAKPTAIVQPSQNMSLPPSMPGAITQPIAVVHPMPNINATRIPSSPPSFEAAIGRTAGSVVDADVQDSMRLLREQVAQVQESLNVRRDEIERRLGLIEQLWMSANLTTAVQEKLCRLAKAISERKFVEAMEIHTAIVAYHSNECATFALALRHIVLTVQPIMTETTTPAAVSENIAVVPAMFVSAMPRQNASSTETRPAGNDSSGYSTVHHI